MDYQEFWRAYVDEVWFRNVQMFHVSSLPEILETMERLKSGEKRFQNALAKTFSKKLKKAHVKSDELRRDFDEAFERAENIDNGLYLRTKEGFRSLSAHRISKFGHAYVADDSDGYVIEAFLHVHLFKKEVAALAKAIREIWERRNLRLVDWKMRKVVDLSEAEATAKYFEEKAIEDESADVSETEAKDAGDSKKSVFKEFLPALPGMLFLCYLLVGIVVDMVKKSRLENLIMIGAVLAIFFALHAYAKLSRWTVTETGFGRIGLFKRTERRFDDVRYVVSRFDDAFFLAFGNGDAQVLKKMSRSDFEKGWDFTWNVAERLRKSAVTAQSEGKGKTVLLDRGTIGKILTSANLKNDQILVRDSVSRLLGTYPQAKRFRKAFFESSGFYFDGARFFNWDFSKIETEKIRLGPDYSLLSGEKLDYVGNAKGISYDLFVGKSWKFYAAKNNLLLLLGNDFESGLHALFSDGQPIEAFDFLKGKIDPREICSMEWRGCEIESTLERLHESVPEFTKRFPKNGLLPLLTRDEWKGLVVYEIRSETYYHIRKPEWGEVFEITEIENEEALKETTGAPLMCWDFFCPAKFRDAFVLELCPKIGIDMPQTRFEAIKNGEPVEGRYEYSNAWTNSRSKILVDESNPEWKPVWIVVSEDMIPSIWETMLNWIGKIEGEFGVSAKNFQRYMESYGWSFSHPRASISPIDGWVSTEKREIVGEYSQFSIIIRSSLAHEAVFDACSVMGIPVDPEYLWTAIRNDGLPGIHCLGIFPNAETGEFVVVDCRNFGDNYCLTVRTDASIAEKIRERMTEWENFLRDMRWHHVRCEGLKNEIDDPDSPLYAVMADYSITEEDLLNNDPETQFSYRGSLRHKIDRFRWRWRI